MAVNYRPIGQEYAKNNGVPWTWFERAIQQESKWDPNTPDSPVGARGIAQLMPVHWSKVDPKNPVASLAYATAYLKQMKEIFGTWPKAFAAYNWGPGNLQKNGMAKLPSETRKYLNIVFGEGKWGEEGSPPEENDGIPVDEREGPGSGSSWLSGGLKAAYDALWTGGRDAIIDRTAAPVLGTAGVLCLIIGAFGLVFRSKTATGTLVGGVVGGPGGAIGGALEPNTPEAVKAPIRAAVTQGRSAIAQPASEIQQGVQQRRYDRSQQQAARARETRAPTRAHPKNPGRCPGPGGATSRLDPARFAPPGNDPLGRAGRAAPEQVLGGDLARRQQGVDEHPAPALGDVGAGRPLLDGIARGRGLLEPGQQRRDVIRAGATGAENFRVVEMNIR